VHLPTVHVSVDHALSCSKDGFPSIRHNEVRDLTAELLSEVCYAAEIEPHLELLNDETFNRRLLMFRMEHV